MDLGSLRQYCLSLPHVTEKVQWGSNLLFCVGGKMFSTIELEPGHPHRFAFKCGDERFAELLEREGVTPAPYLARAKWVALAGFNTLPPAELRQYVREGYEIVLARLPKKQREELGRAPARRARRRSPR